MSIIENIAFRGSLEGLFVVKDAVLEQLNLIGEVLVLDGSIGLMVGDGGEKSIRDCAKESSVDLRVCLESGLHGSWGHCW